MSEHRYPTNVLVADYVRAGAGFAITAGPAAVVPVEGVAAPILGALSLVFAVFGVRTAMRQASRVVMDDESLAVIGPLRRSLAWRELTGMRLRYFATRRDRAAGWMQLVLRAPGATLRLDSTIEGFPAIARRAARAARDNRLPLAVATVDNLRNFGITLEGPGGEPGG